MLVKRDAGGLYICPELWVVLAVSSPPPPP